jgi:hypothetical protein
MDAGFLTPIAWPLVQVFFRYRQMRLWRLVRQAVPGGRRP